MERGEETFGTGARGENVGGRSVLEETGGRVRGNGMDVRVRGGGVIVGRRGRRRRRRLCLNSRRRGRGKKNRRGLFLRSRYRNRVLMMSMRRVGVRGTLRRGAWEIR